MSEYVLAMYDVRSKQEFIYSGRRIKEIIGASHIITDVFSDYLYPAAEKYGKEHSGDNGIYYLSKEQPREEFSRENFIDHIDINKGNYLGEVVYEGGGNFLVLYKDKDTCIGVNKIFTKYLMDGVPNKEDESHDDRTSDGKDKPGIGTLKVLCTYIDSLDFDHYLSDRDRLYELHHIREGQESVIYPVNTMPFVQVSPNSGRPLTNTIKKINEEGEEVDEKVTTEEYAKYKKYDEHIKKLKDNDKDIYDKEEFLLDNLVYDKGNESLLAVIYIDRNGMGAAVQKCLEGEKTYDECVNSSDVSHMLTLHKKKETYEECVTELRNFSADIQTKYVDKRIEKINHALETKHEKEIKKDNKKVRRTIVAAGDEMTIICNARDALDVVKAYFTDYPDDNNASSCVGIAIFHSHSPYADAYRIAEECCENAKSLMKKAGVDKANLMDFCYCQGGIDSSLEKIRERESNGSMYSKPWNITNENGKIEISPTFGVLQADKVKYKDYVTSMAEDLSNIARSNIKDLRQAAESGLAEFEMEIQRIKAHGNNIQTCLTDESDKKDLIYDISMVYDLWFSKDQEKEDDSDED